MQFSYSILVSNLAVENPFKNYVIISWNKKYILVIISSKIDIYIYIHIVLV